jgi:hypothetical protein
LYCQKTRINLQHRKRHAQENSRLTHVYAAAAQKPRLQDQGRGACCEGRRRRGQHVSKKRLARRGRQMTSNARPALIIRWRTHAAAMVPQSGGIGRPCMEAGEGWLWDELTGIPRTLRPM